jgi:hypothetical protein
MVKPSTSRSLLIGPLRSGSASISISHCVKPQTVLDLLEDKVKLLTDVFSQIMKYQWSNAEILILGNCVVFGEAVLGYGIIPAEWRDSKWFTICLKYLVLLFVIVFELFGSLDHVWKQHHHSALVLILIYPAHHGTFEGFERIVFSFGPVEVASLTG